MSKFKLSSGLVEEPEFMVVYGVEGVGKTTFACSAPNAMIGDVEGGSGQIENATRVTPDQLKTFSDVLEFIKFAGESEYETIVIDSLTKVEQLIWVQTCKRKSSSKKQYDSIEDMTYKQGYIFALDEWQMFIDACLELKRKGKRVILVGHNHNKKFEDPTMMESYQRYEIEIHQKAASLVRKYVDAVLFANHKTLVKDGKGLETGERVLYTQRRPGHDAKNRYHLPYELPLDWSEFVAAKVNAKEDPAVYIEQIRGMVEEVPNEETRMKILEAIKKPLTITQLKSYLARVEALVGVEE
jgi:hypothetical protein